MKISGALGKNLVVKQYKDGEVATQFPDMSKIVASAGSATVVIYLKKQLSMQGQSITTLKRKKHTREKPGKIKVYLMLLLVSI